MTMFVRFCLSPFEGGFYCLQNEHYFNRKTHCWHEHRCYMYAPKCYYPRYKCGHTIFMTRYLLNNNDVMINIFLVKCQFLSCKVNGYTVRRETLLFFCLLLNGSQLSQERISSSFLLVPIFTRKPIKGHRQTVQTQIRSIMCAYNGL